MKKIKTEEEEILFLQNNETSKQYKYTKLKYAATNGLLELFTFLYFQFQQTKTFKNTIKEAILLSLKNKHINIIKFLFEEDVKIPNNICKEFIMYVLSNEDELSKFLTEKGYTSDNRNFEWRECLEQSIRRNNIILLSKLFLSYKKLLSPLDIANLLNIDYIGTEIFEFIINKAEPNIFKDEFYNDNYMKIFYIHIQVSNTIKFNLMKALLLHNISNSEKFDILLNKFNFDKDILLLILNYFEQDKARYDIEEHNDCSYPDNYSMFFQKTHQILKDYLFNKYHFKGESREIFNRINELLEIEKKYIHLVGATEGKF